MNRKEIREIKKRFSPDMNNFGHIYGCYVNAAREIITYMDSPTMLMENEEREMYMKTLKKVLSGALGRNLLDVEFSTTQVEDSDEHRLLQTLRTSHLSNETMRKILFQRIIDSVDMGDTGYVILLAADASEYDAVIPVVDGRENPLAALYKGRVYEKIRAALAADDYRVRKIYNKKAVFIDETPYARQYLNMNTPIAYKEALACAINQNRPVPVVSITAETSGTGKTHLITQVIKELSAQGYRVGYVKSTHHMSTGPKRNSDTDLATRAGAVCTALIPDGPKKSRAIEDAAFSMSVDLVLIESRRHGLFPKLLVLPPEAGAAEGDNETVALVTRRKDTNSVHFNTLHADNISALAKYIKLLANL